MKTTLSLSLLILVATVTWADPGPRPEKPVRSAKTAAASAKASDGNLPVSYTHLTLPTKA